MHHTAQEPYLVNNRSQRFAKPLQQGADLRLGREKQGTDDTNHDANKYIRWLGIMGQFNSPPEEEENGGGQLADAVWKMVSAAS